MNMRKIVKFFDRAFNLLVGTKSVYSYKKGRGYSVTIIYSVFGKRVFEETYSIKDAFFS